MTDAEFALFYASLLVYECLFVVCMHFWAWSAEEEWYGEVEGAPSEWQPILKKDQITN